MPLPSYVPRSDSFGNWYFGGFQVDSLVEEGYGAATALTATQAEFNTFLNSALGSTSWANSTNQYYFRFNNSYEPLTGTVTTSANYRFGIDNNGANFTGTFLNTAPTGTPVASTRILPNASNFISQLFGSGNCAFAVANQYGMWLATAAKGTPGTLTTSVTSVYLGWVKDPVFPTNINERVRNLIVGQGTDNGNNAFLATRAASSAAVPSYCFTNSVITCNIATPGANNSDLCVLDPSTSYLNIGSLHNAIFYPGTGLTVGQLCRIPPAKDPDGNTEQNIWLCAGRVYGWNGSAGVINAGYKLIRVWSKDIS